jgi:hypothetical protein
MLADLQCFKRQPYNLLSREKVLNLFNNFYCIEAQIAFDGASEGSDLSWMKGF